MKYLVFQEEMGESGNHHLQGYLEMDRPVRHTHFYPLLRRANFEKAYGTGAQNRTYCTKEETRMSGPFEIGTLSGGQGSRSDILALRDAVKSGKRGRELYDDDAVAGSAIKYGRGVVDMVNAYAPRVSRDDLCVTFHFGPAGTGKTFCCDSGDAYYFDGNNGFWNGYQGEKKV